MKTVLAIAMVMLVLSVGAVSAKGWDYGKVNNCGKMNKCWKPMDFGTATADAYACATAKGDLCVETATITQTATDTSGVCELASSLSVSGSFSR